MERKEPVLDNRLDDEASKILLSFKTEEAGKKRKSEEKKENEEEEKLERKRAKDRKGQRKKRTKNLNNKGLAATLQGVVSQLIEKLSLCNLPPGLMVDINKSIFIPPVPAFVPQKYVLKENTYAERKRMKDIRGQDAARQRAKTNDYIVAVYPEKIAWMNTLLEFFLFGKISSP
jgi:hypothetical protein